MDLRGRLVVVTGASSGLGRAIALELATREGADVVIAARRTDRLDEVADQIRAADGGAVWTCTVDLAAPDGCTELRRRVAEIARTRDAGLLAGDATRPLPGRGVFGIVNNAGITSYGEAARMTPAEVERLLDLNLRAAIELTIEFARDFAHGHERAAARQPSAQPRRNEPVGAVLNITSLGAHVPVPYQAVYAATKHGLQAFTESIATERWARGIVFTAAGPGGVDTEMIGRSGLDAKFASGSSALVSAERAAAQIVGAWKRGRLRYVPGFGNALAAFAGRVLPVRIVSRASARLFEPPEKR